jgi:hypothetical protein
MSLLKKPLLIVSAILALAAFAAPSAASASELWYDSNEEPLSGVENPATASGGGEIEIRTMYSQGIRVNCQIPSVEANLWNDNEIGTASGELYEFQFSNCYFRNTWYPESWNCKGTVTGGATPELPWGVQAIGGGQVRLNDVEWVLDGTKCMWWTGGPQQQEGSLTGDWDNKSQTIAWSSADGVQNPGCQPPNGCAVWRVNGSIGLDTPSENEGPNLVLK